MVELKYFLVAGGVMKIHPSLPFYIYMANLWAKDVSVPSPMIVALANNTLPNIIHAQRDELDTLDEPKQDVMTHTKGEGVETGS